MYALVLQTFATPESYREIEFAGCFPTPRKCSVNIELITVYKFSSPGRVLAFKP